MGLKTILLKRTYSSDCDDILHDFYIPVLNESTEYYRLAGFFSSTSLAIAAKGISTFIRNKGIIKLIVCPKLTKDDLNAIIEAKEHPENYIGKKMSQELNKLGEDFIRDHIFALGWMVANNKLEIRVAIPYNENGFPLKQDELQIKGIFHQKVGIMKDSEGNIVTFSGSINETASGWLNNVEEFKVFRSWIEEEKDYAKSDIEKFYRFWNGSSQQVKTISLPHAVKKKLLEIAPKDIEDIQLDRWYEKTKRKKKKIELYKYQKDAIDAWLKNNSSGIFEMATGTGKTFTALGCANKIFEDESKVLLIITCSYQHLTNQWKNEIKKFGIEYDNLILAYSGVQWKDKFANSLIDLELGYIKKLIVLTTHRTFSSDDFIRIIQRNKRKFNIMLIADEVHWLGAKKSRKGLIKEYDFRLGLSATPQRWFDSIGTQKIYDYFGGIVYEFSLKDAITKINPSIGKTYLTPYRYKPKFVSLTEEELEEYLDKTRTIVVKYFTAKNNEEKDEILENLLFARANIIKNAKRKYDVLKEILKKLNPIKYTLIYCTPQQIDEIMRIISKEGINSHRFTMEESTKPDKKYNGLSERDYLLKKFAIGEYQVLVAMKCLDEGIDVPQARTAILMASSGNSREYIQRIGRVIRRYSSKSEAIIYDIIVAPSLDKNLPHELKELEWKIFEKELRRYKEIAEIAVNNADALKLISDIKNKMKEGKL
ncbi:MAG: hypothetical protein PWQ45_1267 [Thermosipho sp. (in: thermotogales)]|nr:hypothetical protein [Thermosipho sp. (in: thermotogales)]